MRQGKETKIKKEETKMPREREKDETAEEIETLNFVKKIYKHVQTDR
jgi:hypothetical protein